MGIIKDRSGESDLTGGSVRDIISERENRDGSVHTTEVIVNDRGSSRASWDTDKDGNMSDFHVKRN
jgi:hypothetical protein